MNCRRSDCNWKTQPSLFVFETVVQCSFSREKFTVILRQLYFRKGAQIASIQAYFV